MNVLICQPTRHRTYVELLAVRAEATIACKQNFGTACNLRYSYIPSNYNNPSLFLVSVGLKDMDKSDAAVFCNGWEDDRVCLIEHYVATLYNKKIYYFTGKELVAK